jgi:hypothetical protein
MNPSESSPLSPTPLVDKPIAAGPEEPSPPWYLFRSSDVLAAALLAATFLLLSYWPLWHSDIWGHLKFGQWIVQHRELPAQERFSPFTDRQPYIHFQWLTQVGMYLLFAAGERLAGGDDLHRLAGGVEMLASLFAVLGLLRCVFLLLAYRRVSGSMPLACLGVVLAGLIVGRMQRPQVVGEMFFAVLLFALSRPVLSRRALVLIPLCLVLWANLHGSYAVGLVLMALFILGRAIEAARAGSWRLAVIVNDSQVRRLFVAGLLSAVGIALLNPHGPRLYLYTLQFSRHPNIASMVEWQPVDFDGGISGYWGYLVLLSVLIVTILINPSMLSPTRLLLCLSFGVFPLFQQRMIAWWTPLLPWIVLPAWAAAGKRLSWPWLRYRSQANGRKTLIAAVLVFVAVMLSPPMQWLRAHQLRSLDRSLSPGTPWRIAAQLTAPPGDRTYLPELADALRSNHYPGDRFQGRIFTSETQGDYLLWALPPEYPVLMYTHAHLFPPEHWQDCLTVMAGKPGWRAILDRHGVNLVVVEAEERPQLAAALRADADWQVIVDETGSPKKRDPRTRLFVALRKKPLSERAEPRP